MGQGTFRIRMRHDLPFLQDKDSKDKDRGGGGGSGYGMGRVSRVW